MMLQSDVVPLNYFVFNNKVYEPEPGTYVPAYPSEELGMLCQYHKGLTLSDPTSPTWVPPGCPECGKLIDYAICPYCKKAYLNFESNTHDDISASPYVTLSGDLCCAGCKGYEDQDQEIGDQFDEETWQ